MKNKKEIKQLINEIVSIKYQAGKLGLYKTMHALEEPQRVVGYEFADMLSDYQYNKK